MLKKETLTIERSSILDYGDIDAYEQDEILDDIEGDKVSKEGSSKSINMAKKLRQKCPMDVYFTLKKEKVIQSRKRDKARQSTINEACKKELRDRACRDITRWIDDAAIPFHVVKYPSFEVMVESIGQYGVGINIIKF
ncbi:conserved hypothetical protein [Ricinus communis]|uniref:Uncharacterized protein n=1 Tax=Ricinus communis TaxID=3988 RepID=B9RU05_RICCO|nr:conserved hypothetical protein [Ricinus communis]